MRGASAVGRDFSRAAPAVSERRRWLPLSLACILLAALAVVALRVDLIRVRYGLADALRLERSLLEERRAALASVRELRDPTRLSQLAAKQGFVRPERLLELPAAPPGNGERH